MDGFPAYLLLPLLSSLLYVVGAMFIKRSADFGVGVWRTAFVTNVISAVIFMPLLFFGGEGEPWFKLWQPALVGMLFLGGQMLSLLAITRGDVSVATPVMGLKLILVAAFVTFISDDVVSLGLWISAVMSTVAIVLLNLGPGIGHRRVTFTAILAGTGAGCFAMFDVLVQEWASQWGFGRFLPLVLGIVVIYSLVFVPFFHAPLSAMGPPAWGWLVGGAVFVSLQGLFLISTLAIFGEATAVNVVYSARGLWSVVMVWWLGHWFSNPEQQLGARVLKWRLIGALLMMVAIAVVLGE